MRLGEQIKKRRMELKVTQENLAKEIGVSRSAISNWENNRNYPDIQVLINISDVLDISLDQLLKGDEIVVKQMANETKESIRLRKRVKIQYGAIILLLLIIAFILYKSNEYADLSKSKEIVSAEQTEEELVIQTDLPQYRSVVAYTAELDETEESLQVTLITKLDFTMKNEEKISIPISNELKNVKQVEIIYQKEVLNIFPIN